MPSKTTLWAASLSPSAAGSTDLQIPFVFALSLSFYRAKHGEGVTRRLIGGVPPPLDCGPRHAERPNPARFTHHPPRPSGGGVRLVRTLSYLFVAFWFCAAAQAGSAVDLTATQLP